VGSPSAPAGNGERDRASVISSLIPKKSSEVLVFTCFANLFARAPQRWLAARRVDKLNSWYAVYSSALRRISPKLHAHLEQCGLEPFLYVMSWLMTMFSNPLGLEVAVRLWDRVLVGGHEEVLRCVLGLMRYLEPRLLDCSFEGAFHLLTRVPPELRNEFAITEAIDAVKLAPQDVAALAGLEDDGIE
jgi:hypothetical protein